MSLPVEYLPEAADDIDATYTYYEQRLIGLGDRFLETLRELVGRIADNPDLYGVLYKNVRTAPCAGFRTLCTIVQPWIDCSSSPCNMDGAALKGGNGESDGA